MTRTVISVNNLSKSYRLGVIGTGTFFGDFRRWWDKQCGYPEPDNKIGESVLDRRAGKTIWALRDINFTVQEGEALGIIGRNGAGKSTLFKILSQVTAPTGGLVKMKGRSASLLEVGTGFHPDLTGRENIYMNGSIMGMRRTEISRKLDEIVDFSGVENFIDTPVKRYSSGMYVHLAFAVAAHLEPDILIVDEVLAVGDDAFQKKCLEKMGNAGKEGRTVLFISHNMPSIMRLCQRVILLDGGKILQDGPSRQVVGTYLRSGLGSSAQREWPELDKAPGDDFVRLRSVTVRTDDGKISDMLDIHRPFVLEMIYNVLKSGIHVAPFFRLTNEEGTIIFTTMDTDPHWRSTSRSQGLYTSTVRIPENLLPEGNVSVLVAIKAYNPMVKHVSEGDVVFFHIVDSKGSDSTRGELAGELRGVVRPLLTWNTIGPH